MFETLDDLTKNNMDATMKSLSVVSKGPGTRRRSGGLLKKSLEQGTVALGKMLGARSLENDEISPITSNQPMSRSLRVNRVSEVCADVAKEVFGLRGLRRQDAGLRPGEQLTGPCARAGRRSSRREVAVAPEQDGKALRKRRAFCFLCRQASGRGAQAPGAPPLRALQRFADRPPSGARPAAACARFRLLSGRAQSGCLRWPPAIASRASRTSKPPFCVQRSVRPCFNAGAP